MKKVEIGLLDADGHNYPNLPLMKISAWHKAQGDNVELIRPLDTMAKHYDKIYVSRIFGDEYTTYANYSLQADGVVLGASEQFNAELCLLATKGHPHRISKSIRQIVEAPRGRHSEKPAEVRDRIVKLMGDLTRIELFARQHAEGWDCWGNEC